MFTALTGAGADTAGAIRGRYVSEKLSDHLISMVINNSFPNGRKLIWIGSFPEWRDCMKIYLAQTHSEVCGAMQELRSFEKNPYRLKNRRATTS